jgi:hypothetical protein
MKKIGFLLISVAIELGGCATGSVNYVPPGTQAKAGSGSKVVMGSRDEVWARAIPALGKKFFVINNIDKSSGLVNLSYAGSPESYIDCGVITSKVSRSSPPNEQIYTFPGATAYKEYEVVEKSAQGPLQVRLYKRKMALEGRINLVFEELTPQQTRVTVNTRYVVQRQVTVTTFNGYNNVPYVNTDSIAFNTAGQAAFDASISSCAATGALESEILSLVN